MIRILCLALACLALAATAQSHGVTYGYAPGRTVAVRFAYASGEPMSYAAVRVLAPDSTDVEHQNGRTDARGVFAFVPDRTGLWQVAVREEMGHAATMAVAVDTLGEVVPPTASPTTPEASPASRPWLPLACGLSLLANLWLAGRLLARRR